MPSSWAASPTGTRCATRPRTLDGLEIAHDARIVSAHRTPDRLYSFCRDAEPQGTKVIIAGAGGAAHLPGMIAAMTRLPVFGVPVMSRTLSGWDSLLSIVQMPAGVPVGTLAIGRRAPSMPRYSPPPCWRSPTPRSPRGSMPGARPPPPRSPRSRRTAPDGPPRSGAAAHRCHHRHRRGRTARPHARPRRTRPRLSCPRLRPARGRQRRLRHRASDRRRALRGCRRHGALRRGRRRPHLRVRERSRRRARWHRDRDPPLSAGAPQGAGPPDREGFSRRVRSAGRPPHRRFLRRRSRCCANRNSGRHPQGRRLGYDGKGQARVTPDVASEAAFAAIGAVPAILEARIPFVAETSLVLARALDGVDPRLCHGPQRPRGRHFARNALSRPGGRCRCRTGRRLGRDAHGAPRLRGGSSVSSSSSRATRRRR